MASDSLRKQTCVAQQSNRVVAAIGMRRTLKHFLVLCCATTGFVASGLMAIVPSGLSQSTVSVVQEKTQRSSCTTDPKVSMCGSSTAASEPVAAPASNATPISNLAASPQLLNAEQMEQLSDTLLGLLYFALPVGAGLGLFLHDRYQDQRAALLEAQIKLLERLWEQSPQAE